MKGPTTPSTGNRVIFSNINNTKSPQRPLVTFRTLISSSMDSNDNDTSGYTNSPINTNKITRNRTINNTNTFNKLAMSVIVFSLWPLSFLLGLSLLGSSQSSLSFLLSSS